VAGILQNYASVPDYIPFAIVISTCSGSD